jgi:hypothetical protein
MEAFRRRSSPLQREGHRAQHPRIAIEHAA